MTRASVFSPMWVNENRPPPVTLPPINLAGDLEGEAQEAAERVAERRTIREGLDAWHEIARAESFEAWKRIGAALSIGKAYALKVSGANRAWGSTYSRAFNTWLQQYHFDNMRPSTRSVAIELHENIRAIEAWRNGLPEKRRRRLINPLSVTRRWKLSVAHGGQRAPQDLKPDAMAAWRKFVACVEALSQDEAAPLWQVVHNHLSKFVTPQPRRLLQPNEMLSCHSQVKDC